MKLILIILLTLVVGCSNKDVVKVVKVDENIKIINQDVIKNELDNIKKDEINKEELLNQNITDDDIMISSPDDIVKECVLKHLKDDKILRYSRFEVASFKGKVLIIGGVNAVEKIDVIPSDVKLCENVKELNNQVIVDKNPNSSSLLKFDDVIFNEIITKISDNKEINLNNFRILVYKSKVYIMGDASSFKELRKVLKIIRRVSGISNIINYARVEK